ncbi:hypothetical protein [Kribbella caucasensis]|uniref:hypothetical protein n=1 Tax=Kribbella caucasensis TaxID=2512215 RepID=UPI001EDE73E5|nr:hypothetical protein [Kribbella sp. VKM Ac-2527]
MPTRRLPDDPNLEHLRNQAKTLLKQVRSGDPSAVALAGEFHPVDNLADAQLVIARSYGFPSWPRLGRHLALVDQYSRSPHRQSVGGPLETPGQRADEFLKLATLHYGQDDPARQTSARRLLDEFPEVALSNIYTMVVAGELETVRDALDRQPILAGREGGPFRWEPLLYLTYSRLEITPGASVEIARLLLARGADPNAGYLWQGPAVTLHRVDRCLRARRGRPTAASGPARTGPPAVGGRRESERQPDDVQLRARLPTAVRGRPSRAAVGVRPGTW